MICDESIVTLGKKEVSSNFGIMCGSARNRFDRALAKKFRASFRIVWGSSPGSLAIRLTTDLQFPITSDCNALVEALFTLSLTVDFCWRYQSAAKTTEIKLNTGGYSCARRSEAIKDSRLTRIITSESPMQGFLNMQVDLNRAYLGLSQWVYMHVYVFC